MGRLNILVVENESLVALEIMQTIRSFGYERVEYATNSKGALERLGEGDFNLVLMDINLDETQDGIELFNLMRSKQSSLMVVYLTAYKDENTISRAIETEPIGYLIKPHSDDELKAILMMAEYKLLSRKERKRVESIPLGEGYYFDEVEDKLFFEDIFIHLGKKELALLKLLISAKGNFVSYYTIEQEVWEGEIVSSSALRTLIYRLRGKLKYKLIESQSGYGIRLSTSF